MKKRCPLRQTGGRRHGVDEDDNRVVLTQFMHQVLDLGRANRIEGRTGLVYQDAFWPISIVEDLKVIGTRSNNFNSYISLKYYRSFKKRL